MGRGTSRRSPALTTSPSYPASSSSGGSSSKTAGSEFDSDELWKDYEGAVATEDVAPGTSSRPSALRTSALHASQHSKKRALALQAVEATFAKPAEGDRILVLRVAGEIPVSCPCRVQDAGDSKHATQATTLLAGQ